MGRLNDLHSRYGAQGLVVLCVNSTDTSSQIDAFISTWGATSALAMVPSQNGYTVPIFSWAFAISRTGVVLWSGLNDNITDAMVEQWLAPEKPKSDEEEGKCNAGENSSPALAAALAAIAWRLRRRRLTTVRARR